MTDPHDPAYLERAAGDPTVDEDTVTDRTQEIEPEDADVLADPDHDRQTAAEAAEQADPGVTGADPGA